ncbi:MAG TPA: GrpB family protein [Propionibacteriaceae bacterium]
MTEDRVTEESTSGELTTEESTSEEPTTNEPTAKERTHERALEQGGPPLLRPSEGFAADAHRILTAERALLTRHGIGGDLVLVGGTSVPGALTKGDVDLHLRVPPNEFETVVSACTSLHSVVHPEIWQPTLATFAVAAPLPTGLAVTPAGSEHDLRFTRTWQLLADDPQLVAAYNEAKLAGDTAGPGYEQRKSDFFDELLTR